MKISIQMLSLDTLEFFFLFDHRHEPIIEVEGMQYNSLTKLTEAFPRLFQEKHLEKLAQMANFLANGIEFQFIENIEEFKKNYLQHIETEQSSSLYEGFPFTESGSFDLSIMHTPTLKNRKLIFFVKHDYFGVPYQVTLRYPTKKDELPEILYELLPNKVL